MGIFSRDKNRPRVINTSDGVPIYKIIYNKILYDIDPKMNKISKVDLWLKKAGLPTTSSKMLLDEIEMTSNVDLKVVLRRLNKASYKENEPCCVTSGDQRVNVIIHKDLINEMVFKMKLSDFGRSASRKFPELKALPALFSLLFKVINPHHGRLQGDINAAFAALIDIKKTEESLFTNVDYAIKSLKKISRQRKR